MLQMQCYAACSHNVRIHPFISNANSYGIYVDGVGVEVTYFASNEMPGFRLPYAVRYFFFFFLQNYANAVVN